jgi:hypothetical protein
MTVSIMLDSKLAPNVNYEISDEEFANIEKQLLMVEIDLIKFVTLKETAIYLFKNKILGLIVEK